MDETPVQVLDEPNKTAQSQSYMWVMRGGPPEQRAILYAKSHSNCGRVRHGYGRVHHDYGRVHRGYGRDCACGFGFLERWAQAQ